MSFCPCLGAGADMSARLLCSSELECDENDVGNFDLRARGAPGEESGTLGSVFYPKSNRSKTISPHWKELLSRNRYDEEHNGSLMI